MSREELEEQVRELQREIFNLRFRKAAQQLDNPVRVRLVRKDLARALSILHEIDMGIVTKAGEGN
jgi:large subunit ribosomal protein L29